MSDEKTYGVRFIFDSQSPGPGHWVSEQLFGLTSEAAALHFYQAAISNPHMREIKLIHGDDVVEEHD
jgi:hypothetical protein